jgi:acyl dehydratase
MIDRRHIGHALPAFSVPVEAGRLRFFAKATGNDDPVYLDPAAACDAGHPDLPVPPTFLFCLEMESPEPAALRTLLGIDYRRILHGEQQFTYHAMAHAGDTLHFEPRVADIYDRKGGALEFVRRETRVTNQHGALIAELTCLTVVRNG